MELALKSKEIKSVLLIVGNGFDLNLELETSYNQFLNSLGDEKNKNNLIYELNLRNKADDKNWVDIEKELENCAVNGLDKIRSENMYILHNSDRSNIFEKENYIELKLLLKNYLIKQDEKEIINFKDKSSYKLLLELCKRENIYLTILNFNYTNTIDTKLINYIKAYHEKDIRSRYKHIFVHGNLNEDVVFGIADNAEITKQHHYLLKSFDTINNTKINISKLLNNSDEIFFYGYSLGETDSSYFDDFFKERCIYNDNIEEENKKKITFYHYKDDGKNDLFDRLFTLTNHNMSKFSHLNLVNYIYSN